MGHYDVKFLTLSRMPGKTSGFVDFMLRFIRYTDSQQVISRARAHQWFAQNSSVGPNFIANCTQLLWRLDVIVTEGDEVWYVGDFGQQLLAAASADQARLVAVQLIQRVDGMHQMLHIFAKAGNSGLRFQQATEALSIYYGGKPPNAQDRTDWLRACRCLQAMGKAGLRITSLGRKLAASFPPEPLAEVALLPPSSAQRLDPLAEALEHDARDSDSPSRFEQTVRLCFAYLGFQVAQRGSRGDTDMLAVAPLGLERFSFIIDAKTNRDGKIRDLNAPNIKKHRERHGADFALIVAPDFERGESVVEQAENYQIVLLTTRVLRQLMELHATTPQNLLCYRALFERSGVVEELPRAILAVVEQRNRAFDLALDVFATLSSLDRQGPIPALEVEWILLGKMGSRPTPDEARQALQLLAHPAIGAVAIDDQQHVAVTMTRATLQATLQQLAYRVCAHEDAEDML